MSNAHFSWVYSANLLMKESSFSGMMTLSGETGWAGPGEALLPLAAPQPTGSITQVSLEGLHRPGIKVALSIHRGLFLRLGRVRGVHVVGGQRPRNGAQTRHGDSVKLLVVFLRVPRIKERIRRASRGRQSTASLNSQTCQSPSPWPRPHFLLLCFFDRYQVAWLPLHLTHNPRVPHPPASASHWTHRCGRQPCRDVLPELPTGTPSPLRRLL